MNASSSTSSSASAPPHPSGVPLCVACGGYHGAVGAEIHCLRAAVQALRAALRARDELPSVHAFAIAPRRGPFDPGVLPMNKSSRPAPHSSGLHATAALQSLGTIAALLPTCLHPDESRVTAQVTAIGSRVTPLTWCSLCGAIATDDGNGAEWQRPVAAMLLAKARFEELSVLLHALRDSIGAAPASTETPHLDALRAAATGSPLLREIDALDRVLTQLPSSALPFSFTP